MNYEKQKCIGARKVSKRDSKKTLQRREGEAQNVFRKSKAISVADQIVGQKFGKWLVTGVAPRKGKKAFVYCTCECGKKGVIQTWNLTSGASPHCQACRARNLFITHGKTRSPEYAAWRRMKDRCTNPNRYASHRYFGRGIKVCERWASSFENFYRDMGPRPSSKHSIDRINNNGDYEPGNCRWATQKEQMNNTCRSPQYREPCYKII